MISRLSGALIRTTDDGRALLFIFEQICGLVCPEQPEPEYKLILNGIKSAGFLPFYVSRQPNAEYLKVQEGSITLFNRYEVAYGNLYR